MKENLVDLMVEWDCEDNPTPPPIEKDPVAEAEHFEETPEADAIIAMDEAIDQLSGSLPIPTSGSYGFQPPAPQFIGTCTDVSYSPLIVTGPVNFSAMPTPAGQVMMAGQSVAPLGSITLNGPDGPIEVEGEMSFSVDDDGNMSVTFVQGEL